LIADAMPLYVGTRRKRPPSRSNWKQGSPRCDTARRGQHDKSLGPREIFLTFLFANTNVAGCGFVPSSCRPTLKITKLYDTRMLILVRKRLISVFLSGESDIRNGIYGRPTTQQSVRKTEFSERPVNGAAQRRPPLASLCCFR